MRDSIPAVDTAATTAADPDRDHIAELTLDETEELILWGVTHARIQGDGAERAVELIAAAVDGVTDWYARLLLRACRRVMASWSEAPAAAIRLHDEALMHQVGLGHSVAAGRRAS